MSDLLNAVKAMAKDLNVSLDAGEVSKALDSHRKSLVKDIIALNDPATRSIMKGKTMQRLDVASDPDVVAHKTLARVNARLHEAATIAALGEETLTALDRAERFLKSIGKETKAKGSGETTRKSKATKTKATKTKTKATSVQ